jgi:UrcA family protein
MNKILSLALRASIVALAVAPAASASAQETFAVTVNYRDLNLASPEGAKTLYQRITTAAKQGCGSQPEFRDMAYYGVWRACVKDAVDHAVRRLNVPMVTALNGGRPASQVQLAQAH